MDIRKSELLSTFQRFDLMGTGCSANCGCIDEYALEVDRIARLVSDGRPLRDAISVTFDDHFWSGCLREPDRAIGFEKLLTDLEQRIGH